MMLPAALFCPKADALPHFRSSIQHEIFGDAADLRSMPARRHLVSHPFIERLRQSVSFDHFAVTGLDFDGYRFGSGHSIDSDFPPAYLDAYYGDGLLDVDPLVAAAKTASTFVLEEGIYESNPAPARILYLGRAFRIVNRTLFPLRRGDILFGAVIFARKNAFDDSELQFLSEIAEVTHHVITRPIMEKFSAQTLKLSEGELICLRLASFGKTSEEVSEECGYALDTVNSYIKTACRKLRANNRGHAIAEAIRRGLIQ